MNDCMTFPDTVEEFMEQYKVVDAEHIYTNGSEFVPIFRMKQWFEHLPSEQSEPEAISEWKKEFREYVGSLDIARDDWKGIIEYIDELPSIQPEIIRCKDCEYLCNEDGLRGMCWHINGFGTDVKDKYNSFCSWAKRREVTE